MDEVPIDFVVLSGTSYLNYRFFLGGLLRYFKIGGQYDTKLV